MNNRYVSSSVLAAAVAALMGSGFAVAEDEAIRAEDRQSAISQAADRTDVSGDAREEMREDAGDAQEQVNEALRVVGQMKKDPQLTSMIERAQGVLLVPAFGKAALGVGGRGGEGVLLLKRDGEWSAPAFYNFGRVSAGLQAGAEAGSVAMLLMTQDAVEPFIGQDNNFALDAAAGLTVVNYSTEGRATAGEPDVVVWSDTEGLFAGASIGISGFTRDEDENRAYYQRQATPQQIFAGSVKNPHADALRDALPAQTASR